jgi:hypothetical protein
LFTKHSGVERHISYEEDALVHYASVKELRIRESQKYEESRKISPESVEPGIGGRQPPSIENDDSFQHETQIKQRKRSTQCGASNSVIRDYVDGSINLENNEFS